MYGAQIPRFFALFVRTYHFDDTVVVGLRGERVAVSEETIVNAVITIIMIIEIDSEMKSTAFRIR